MTHLLLRLVDACVTRYQLRGRASVAHAVRLAGAAVAAFAVAQMIFPKTIPVLAALTALLVVEVTLKDIVTSGVQRVASVGTGVLVAVLFSSLVGLSWWSLGALIAVSVLVGQILRLGPHTLEVPISAMLVLAVGGAESAAVDRISETLIGAAVGVGVNLVFAPKVRADTAGDAVQALAGRLAGLLRAAASELHQPITVDLAAHWLTQARALSRDIPEIDRAVREAEHSRRLNPRALVLPDTSNTLRADLDALEQSAVSVRSMFRTILDGVRPTRAAGSDGAGHGEPDGRDVRMIFGALLDDLAIAIEAFGDLARAEGTNHIAETQDDAVAAVAGLREARDRIDDLELIDFGSAADGWELSDPILLTVGRVLSDLDTQERARRRKPALVPVTMDPIELIKNAQHSLHLSAPRPGQGRPFRGRPGPAAGRPTAGPGSSAEQTGSHRLPHRRTPRQARPSR